MSRAVPNVSTPDPEQPTFRLPHWGWFLVATVALVAIAVGLHLGMPIWRQRAAIREIRRLGGRVTMHSGGPERVRRWIGDENMQVFDEVHSVNLRELAITDADLSNLTPLPSVMRLDLAWTLNTESRVTDAGAAKLAALTKITDLSLYGTQIGDRGLAALRRLNHLQILRLDHTPITDAGLEHVGALTNLQQLYLNSTRVGDAGLAHLTHCSKLETLWLADTQVTDASLVHLKRLSHLRRVILDGTRVSETGVADLARALPSTFVHKER
jgi:Leucine-rich repeat (LRR) protein